MTKLFIIYNSCTAFVPPRLIGLVLSGSLLLLRYLLVPVFFLCWYSFCHAFGLSHSQLLVFYKFLNNSQSLCRPVVVPGKFFGPNIWVFQQSQMSPKDQEVTQKPIWFVKITLTKKHMRRGIGKTMIVLINSDLRASL